MDLKELAVNEEKHIQKNHPWEYARAHVINNLLKHIIKNDNSIHCAVDVGCGDVFFLNLFCKKNSVNKAIAVDTAFTNDIVAPLKQKNKEIIFVNNIDQVNLRGEKADVVFLMDVIEHIKEDVDFLRILSQKDFIGDETLFVITVPAFNKLFSSHDKFVGHYRRYSHRTLHKAIVDAGLQSIHSGYFFFSLLVPRLIIKRLETINGGPKESPHGAGGWDKGTLVSKIYEWILRIDGEFLRLLSLIGIRIPGLSTYAICKLKL